MNEKQERNLIKGIALTHSMIVEQGQKPDLLKLQRLLVSVWVGGLPEGYEPSDDFMIPGVFNNRKNPKWNLANNLFLLLTRKIQTGLITNCVKQLMNYSSEKLTITLSRFKFNQLAVVAAGSEATIESKLWVFIYGIFYWKDSTAMIFFFFWHY